MSESVNSFIPVGDLSSSIESNSSQDENKKYSLCEDESDKESDNEEENEEEIKQGRMIKEVIETLYNILPPVSIDEYLHETIKEMRDLSVTLNTLDANYRNGVCDSNKVPAIYYHSVYTVTRNHYDFLKEKVERLKRDKHYRVRILGQIEYLQKFV
jgi:hypothetical protein